MNLDFITTNSGQNAQSNYDGNMDFFDSERARLSLSSNASGIFLPSSPKKSNQNSQKFQLQPAFDYLPPSSSSKSTLSQGSNPFTCDQSLFGSQSSLSSISTPPPYAKPIISHEPLRIDHSLSHPFSEPDYPFSPLMIDPQFYSPTKFPINVTQSSPPQQIRFDREDEHGTIKRSKSVRGKSYQNETGLRRSQSARRTKQGAATSHKLSRTHSHSRGLSEGQYKPINKYENHENFTFLPPTPPAEIIESTPMLRKQYQYIPTLTNDAADRARYISECNPFPLRAPLYQEELELEPEYKAAVDLNPSKEWTPLDQLTELPSTGTFIPLYQRLTNLSNSLRASDLSRSQSHSSQTFENFDSYSPFGISSLPNSPQLIYEHDSHLSPFLSPGLIASNNLFLLSSNVVSITSTLERQNLSSSLYPSDQTLSPLPSTTNWIGNETIPEDEYGFLSSLIPGGAKKSNTRDFSYSYRPGSWKIEEEPNFNELGMQSSPISRPSRRSSSFGFD